MRSTKEALAFWALTVLMSALPLVAQDTPEETSVATQPTPDADSGQKPAAGAENADSLRKAAQNPVASLISVPLQFNWTTNLAPMATDARSR